MNRLGLKDALGYIYAFAKWIAAGIATGLVCGVVGALFARGVDWATRTRLANGYLIWLMPLGGVAIVGLYRMAKIPISTGTDCIISSVRTQEKVPLLVAPLIFISTVITHLVGGSAGREGAALAALCALVAVGFCQAMHHTPGLLKRLIPNDFARIAAAGIAIAALTTLIGSQDYNGSGMSVIERALDGHARPWDFALKILFTALTLGAGYKGGEIVPSFFVGSTFGCVMGAVLGFEPSLGAALGLISVFCGVTNTPLSSLILSVSLKNHCFSESCPAYSGLFYYLKHSLRGAGYMFLNRSSHAHRLINYLQFYFL